MPKRWRGSVSTVPSMTALKPVSVDRAQCGHQRRAGDECRIHHHQLVIASSVTAQYCEQCEMVHNRGQRERDLDLYRSQVGIFLAYSYGFLFVAAVSENLADER